MSSLIFDIEQLYQRTFGSKPYVVPGKSAEPAQGSGYTLNGTNTIELFDKAGNTLQSTYKGIEVWLPTKLRGLPTDLFENGVLDLPFCVIRMSGSSTIVRTPMLERRGTAKELYSVDDYKISLKGFLIDSARLWPYDELKALKKLHEMGTGFFLDNALSNVFLDNGDKAVITGFDLVEVEGGRKHVRPFNITLESDSIFTLEWNG